MSKILIPFVIILLTSPNFILIVNSQNLHNDSHNCPDHKYAVIIVGRYAGRIIDIIPKNFQQYYSWYSRAVQLLYTTLKEKYHYDDENIILLFPLRKQLVLYKGFDENWIDGNSSKENLKLVINNFINGEQNQLNDNDSLLFCFIDHGNDDTSEDGVNASNTFFAFPYNFNNIEDFFSYYIFKKNQDRFLLYDWELATMFDNFTNGRIIFLLQPCNSGGFINDLSRKNRIICTSSRENETSNQAWIEPFVQGLSGLADSNNDSIVTILEAYTYAFYGVYNKTKIEHPLIDDNGDGVGHFLFERDFDPINSSRDGYLASITYL